MVFHASLQQAFPGSALHFECGEWFRLAWQAHDLPRTLQFICLATLCKIRVQELTMRHGDTRLSGQENSKTCYIFDDDDDV